MAQPESLADILAGLTTPGAALSPPPKPRCRAACGVPLADNLVDHEDNTGLHYGCDEPVDTPVETAVDSAVAEPPSTVDELLPVMHQHEAANPPAPAYALLLPATPATPPPSTVAELRDVLMQFEAQRPRSMQKRLGPSELGTPCQQQIARKLAGAPRQPVTEPTWAPFQGTAMHASMEEVVAFWNKQLGRERWLAEDELEADPGMEGVAPIRGHGDAFDTDWDCVVDWKHVGTTALDKLRAAKRADKPAHEQVSAEYRVQGHIYGLGHERKGRKVRFVRLVLLARSWQYDDSEEWTEAYDPDIALEAIARYYATHDLLAALDVANHPERITAVPAAPSSDACKFCPFARPGKASDWAGCAGDTATYERKQTRFADGLIGP
jgi:hypothetical protein